MCGLARPVKPEGISSGFEVLEDFDGQKSVLPIPGLPRRQETPEIDGRVAQG